jgi:hypothetical protein
VHRSFNHLRIADRRSHYVPICTQGYQFVCIRKIPILIYFPRLWEGKCWYILRPNCIYCRYLVYVMAIWYIFCRLVYFSHFGKFHPGKSGNPGCAATQIARRKLTRCNCFPGRSTFQWNDLRHFLALYLNESALMYVRRLCSFNAVVEEKKYIYKIRVFRM